MKVEISVRLICVPLCFDIVRFPASVLRQEFSRITISIAYNSLPVSAQLQQCLQPPLVHLHVMLNTE